MPGVDAVRQESNFIELSKAVARAHSRLFPDEGYEDPRTLQVIALALTDLMPIYCREDHHQLTEPELVRERFTGAAMEKLLVSATRFQAALDTMQVPSLDQARASLTLRQSPRYLSARR